MMLSDGEPDAQGTVDHPITNGINTPHMLFDVDIKYESIDSSMVLSTLQNDEHKIDSALKQRVNRRSLMARKFRLDQTEAAAFTFYIIFTAKGSFPLLFSLSPLSSNSSLLSLSSLFSSLSHLSSNPSLRALSLYLLSDILSLLSMFFSLLLKQHQLLMPLSQ